MSIGTIGSSFIKHLNSSDVLAYPESLKFEMGSWEVCKWSQIAGQKKLILSSPTLKFTLLADRYGNVGFILESKKQNPALQQYFLEAGFSEQIARKVYDSAIFQAANHQEMKQIYQILLRYGLEDPHGIIQKVAKYGTWKFPELVHQSGDWKVDIGSKGYRKLTMKSSFLIFRILGEPDGTINFKLSSLDDFGFLLKQLLKDAGIDPSRLNESCIESFETQSQEERKKVYEILCRHHPIQENKELIKRLCDFDNWKLEEADRIQSLQLIDRKV